MKHVIRGTVLFALIGLGLSLGMPAFAEQAATNGQLDEGDQAIFAKLDEQNPWYDPIKSGGGGADGGGGGIGGGGNGAVIPEPGTIALLGLGLGALGVARRRQKAAKSS